MAEFSTEIQKIKCHPAVSRIYTSRVKLKKSSSGYVGICPFHNDHTPSFGIFKSSTDGAWLYNCFGKCDVKSGNVFDFLRKKENMSLNEAIKYVSDFVGESWEAKKELVNSTFSSVAEEKKAIFEPLDHYVANFEKSLENNKQALSILLNERGITPETAKLLHLGFKHSIGALGGKDYKKLDKTGWISFPCVEGNKVVFIKYRALDSKVFSAQPGMKTSLFNTECIDPVSPVYVVEGEYDAAVLVQAGFNAVSIPNAKASVTPEMKDQIMVADYAILAGDCDNSVGDEAMDRLWHDLDRSYRLRWPDGCKDANETFLKVCEGDVNRFRTLVETLTEEAVKTPMPGIYDLAEVIKNSDTGSLAARPDRLHFPWKNVDDMAILLPGSVASWFATNTGMGKTCLLMNVTVDEAVKKAETVVNYQCELTPEEFGNMTIAYLTQTDRNKITKEARNEAYRKLSGVNYYIGRNETLSTVNPVLDAIEAAVKRFSATIVVLDHIHFICRNTETETQDLANAMHRIKTMAQKYKLKFIVVGQPRKATQQTKGKVVHITDAKGSEAFASDSDAVFAIHRDCLKNKDPKNPPVDEYDTRTEVHLLKVRAKGEGKALSRLRFFGNVSTFREEINVPEPEFGE